MDYTLGGRELDKAGACASGGWGNLNIKVSYSIIYIFSSIDLYRNDLLLILSRMVCFYRAEAYHVAGFSAVKTAVRTLVTGPSVGRPSVPMPVGGTYGTYHPGPSSYEDK